MNAKRSPFQDGQEHTRTELWPDLPEGYRRGNISGTGYIHITAPCCVMCGAFVGDVEKHDLFHDQLAVAAHQADQASAMTNVIGPPASFVEPDRPQVVDLMAALEQSVAAAKEARKRHPQPPVSRVEREGQ